jgi:uncharacterized coiled-coil protein SlyX
MESLNPVFDDSFSSTLAINGHPYIAAALVIMQIAIVVLIPLYSRWSTKKSEAIAEDKKKIIDLERAITKHERDKQIAETNTRVDRHEQKIDYIITHMKAESDHKYEELSEMIAGIKSTFDRIFKKLDRIEDDIKIKRKQ